MLAMGPQITKLGSPFAINRGFFAIGDPMTLPLNLTPTTIAQPSNVAAGSQRANGVIPMGAVIVDEKIYASAMENATAPIELFHGYTYSAHPMAVAAASATLRTKKADARAKS